MKHVQDEYTPILDQIRAASDKLNRAGDEASEKIEALEKRLLDTEPGVTVWGPVISVEDTERHDEESGASEQVQRRVSVGFGRAKKKWGFLIREALFGKKRPRDSEWTVPLAENVRALRKVDRDVRILAVPQLGAVVEAVLAELNRRVQPLFPDTPERGADTVSTDDLASHTGPATAHEDTVGAP